MVGVTYEEPDSQGDHVLFTHPRTTLRELDPFIIATSGKGADWSFPDLHIAAHAVHEVRGAISAMEAARFGGHHMFRWAAADQFDLEVDAAIQRMERG